MKLPRKTEEVRFHFKHKNSNAFDASRGFRKQRGREDATQRPISTLGSFLLLLQASSAWDQKQTPSSEQLGDSYRPPNSPDKPLSLFFTPCRRQPCGQPSPQDLLFFPPLQSNSAGSLE